MKFFDYLRDKLPALFIAFTAWATALIFLIALRADIPSVIAISVLSAIAAASIVLWDFLRKKKFYDKLTVSLEELDKKYLLSEMIPHPNFHEGRILYEVLQETNKSMCENVADYRKQSQEFREYIELWVHEVKIPVSGLLLMSHNHPDYDGKLNIQLHRIDDYIEDVLYYSRSENAEKDYIIKETSLKRVFADVAVKNRELLQLKNMNIKTDGLDIQVLTDAKWLAFIFGQLMANSLKYVSSKRTPEISVYAEDLPDRSILHFKDNGIGIPQTDIPYIFEKSYTGSNGRNTRGATGMGLYIVKNLCDKLGHTISVTSIRNEYTEFILTFGKDDFYRMK